MWLFNLHSSSRSRVATPPPNKVFRNPCFGASGVSFGRNNSPSISFKFSLKWDKNECYQGQVTALLFSIHYSCSYLKLWTKYPDRHKEKWVTSTGCYLSQSQVGAQWQRMGKTHYILDVLFCCGVSLYIRTWTLAADVMVWML